MQKAAELVEWATKGFRDCGMTWPEVSMMLEFCAKDCRPNKTLESMFYNIAVFCSKLPENIQSSQLKFEYSEDYR